MGTKRVQFFMTPSEFQGFVTEVRADLNLDVVDAGMRKWVAGMAGVPRHPLFIVPGGSHRPSGHSILPARDGWLVATAPTVDGRALYLAEVAGKEDWIDAAAKVTRTNPEVGRLFRRVALRLKRMVTFSVLATNEITGKSALYRDIGYSDGARRWLAENGGWRQEGVANIRFSLGAPTVSQSAPSSPPTRASKPGTKE